MITPEMSAENLARLSFPNLGRIVLVIRGDGGEPGEETLKVIAGMGGRSDGSKNRMYVPEINEVYGPIVRTDLFDHSKASWRADATLYTAHMTRNGWHVASNGKQTVDIVNSLADNENFEEGHNKHTHEGKENDNTPRITVAVYKNMANAAFIGQILPDPKDPDDMEKSLRQVYIASDAKGSGLSFNKGEGYLVSTYDGRGGTGANYERPWGVLMPGTLEDNMTEIWERWDPKTRGNLWGKQIKLGTERFTYSYRSIHSVEYDPNLLVFPGRAA